ncbi:oligosaccharide flippase family protein [Flavobacterium sp. WC2430]|uniref:oligosaccharide flippase family protein n=1 Tax=Flavobacterium sp. WC2430 TaxID=3234137 RepID=UPI003467EAC0
MIKKILNSKNHKLISNFSYLSILQLSNLLIPIITYPLLIKRLGGDSYGKVVFAQAIMAYFAIIVSFGFNIIGTKEVSIHRNNITKLSKIVSSIFQVKFFLFFFSIIIMLVYILIFDVPKKEIELYFFSIWVCLNEFLFPTWYFQGLEKMKNIAIISIINKLLVLFCIVVFIKKENDYILVPLINLIGVGVSCIIGLYYLRKDNIKFRLQSNISMLHYIKKSYVMALSFSVNTIKTNLNIILAKYFFTYSAVAYFDLALKIVNIFISFLDIISQSIYPKMSITKDKIFLNKILKFSLAVSLILMLAVQISSGLLIRLLGGEKMIDSINILRILAIVFPIYIMGALLGRNALIIYGHNSSVLKSMIYSGIFYVLFIFVFYYFLKINSLQLISISFVLSFLVETIYRYKECKKFKII